MFTKAEYLAFSRNHVFPKIDPVLLDLMDKSFDTANEIIKAFGYLKIIPKNMSLERRIEIAKYNMLIESKMESELYSKLELQLGEFSLVSYNKLKDNKKPIKNNNGDSPNPLYIIDKDGNPLAIINFYIIPHEGTNKPKELRINLIQTLRDSNEQLKKLSEQLKESWTINIVKAIKKWCNKKNIKIIGEFTFWHLSRSIVRQYLLIYLKSGLSFEDIDITNIKKDHGEWLERNMKIRKERLEGKRPMQRTEPKRKAKIQAKRPMA